MALLVYLPDDTFTLSAISERGIVPAPVLLVAVTAAALEVFYMAAMHIRRKDYNK